MSLEKSNFELVGGVLRAPNFAFRVGMALGRTTLVQARNAFVLSQPPDFGERLAQDHPLAEADLGVRTMNYGEKKDDPELVFNGEAILAKAVIKAANDENISDDVTKEIVELVLDRRIEIELAPLLPDADIHRVGEIIEDYQN